MSKKPATSGLFLWVVVCEAGANVKWSGESLDAGAVDLVEQGAQVSQGLRTLSLIIFNARCGIEAGLSDKFVG